MSYVTSILFFFSTSKHLIASTEAKAEAQSSRKNTILVEMASITMTASFLGGSASVAASKHRSTTDLCRGFRVAAKASEVIDSTAAASLKNEREEGSSSARRELMFAAAAVAVCSVTGVAAAYEPKPGTPEAKKKYAPVCVTMPTARICRN
ncbi:hypothetical protein U1Q18_025431 [Sarracenia purpurea var. burkii]